MKFDRYMEESNRTCVQKSLDLSPKDVDLLHASMGIVTEAGELMDTVKKYLMYGSDLDVPNLFEELGDLMWYVALLCRCQRFDIHQILQYNIDKLRIRYPEKFTKDYALNRNLKDEQEIFKKIQECSSNTEI